MDWRGLVVGVGEAERRGNRREVERVVGRSDGRASRRRIRGCTNVFVMKVDEANKAVAFAVQ
jgi:hypothetical protein